MTIELKQYVLTDNKVNALYVGNNLFGVIMKLVKEVLGTRIILMGTLKIMY